MGDGPAEPGTDSKWPKLLSLSAHEFRSPLSVVAGYVRMLLQERAGPLSDQQRRLLQETEKACGRLSHLVAELSELSQLESGAAPFNRSTVDVTAILAEAITALPDGTPDVLVTADKAMPVHGDPTRLRTAFSSILHALRRELVEDDRLLVRVEPAGLEGQHSVRVTIAGPPRIEELRRLEPAAMTPFDEWRGGNGLALQTARRVIEAHGGRIWSPAGGSNAAVGRASAVIMLPSTR
jgi:signal transduction histidine kinase